jgi:hypothetical protein
LVIFPDFDFGLTLEIFDRQLPGGHPAPHAREGEATGCGPIIASPYTVSNESSEKTLFRNISTIQSMLSSKRCAPGAAASATRSP